MTDMERKTFCASLSRYGAQAQITMVFEEMAELQDVLCKFLRGRVDGDTCANIAEEIADVGITLDQLMASVTCICSVDVAPVVRCKVCRSYNKPRVGWCEVHLDREHPDDFCSYGKYQTNGGADNA